MLVEELSFFIIDNRVKVIGIERFCFFKVVHLWMPIFKFLF